jgi:two-component system LytT family response regulator
MKVLLIEDEVAAARRLQKMLVASDPACEILGICDSVVSSVTWLSQNPQPDLIFMDIQLADGLSFDIFSRTEITAPVIFTTAYDEYALRAFKVNSIEYLLKPISSEDLNSALNKFTNLYSDKNMSRGLASVTELLLHRGNIHRSRFLVAKGNRWIPVLVEDVAWYVSEDKRVFAITKSDQKHMLDLTLEQLEEQLDPEKCIRANRQYLISRDCVKEVQIGENGKLHLTVAPRTETPITISRDKSHTIRSWLGK